MNTGGEARAPEISRGVAATAVVLVQARTRCGEREGVSDRRKTLAIGGEAVGKKLTQNKINTVRVERDTQNGRRLDQGEEKRKESWRGDGANVRNGVEETAEALGSVQTTMTTSVTPDAVEGLGRTSRIMKRWAARPDRGSGVERRVEWRRWRVCWLRGQKGWWGRRWRVYAGGVTRVSVAPAIAGLATGARTMETVIDAEAGGKTFPGGAR